MIGSILPSRRGDILVLCYHAVSEDWEAALSVTPAQFESQIGRLASRGYRGVTFSDAVAAQGTAQRLVAVTFDDSYRSVHRLAAPILARYGMPGTVFVPTAHVGSEQPMVWPGIDIWLGGRHEHELVPMSWPELIELADAGWEVGSHTRTHPRLTTLDDETLRAELVDSRHEVERGMNRPCPTIAYPYGDEDERVEAAAEQAGYASAAALPFPLPHAPAPYRWPRVGVYHVDDLSRFARKTSPAVRRIRRHPAFRIVHARHRVIGRLRGRSGSS